MLDLNSMSLSLKYIVKQSTKSKQETFTKSRILQIFGIMRQTFWLILFMYGNELCVQFMTCFRESNPAIEWSEDLQVLYDWLNSLKTVKTIIEGCIPQSNVPEENYNKKFLFGPSSCFNINMTSRASIKDCQFDEYEIPFGKGKVFEAKQQNKFCNARASCNCTLVQIELKSGL